MSRSNILNKILETKALEVAKLNLTASSIKKNALHNKNNNKNSDFYSSLVAHHNKSKSLPTIISEVKVASPSAGKIREKFNLTEVVDCYNKHTAVAAISVLTDKEYFLGDNDNLTATKKLSSKPVLRKDFVINEIQIYEAKAINAQAILLIMAALDISDAIRFEKLANDLNLDVLVEVHNYQELDLALSNLKTKLIGINNRNLINFTTNIETTVELIKNIPNDYFVVSESGIKSFDQISRLQDSGVCGFLIGETFMKEKDITLAIDKLIKL